MPDAAARVEVGVVSKAHGLKGEVVAIPYDPASESLLTAATVWIAGRAYTVADSRPVGGAFLLALDGVTDRDQAAALRGLAIELDRDELDLDDGDVLLGDLVGCQARLPDGTPWGEIVAVQLGVQDRLVVHHAGMERLLPVVDAFVGAIDLEARVVTVTPPDGLPEDPIE